MGCPGNFGDSLVVSIWTNGWWRSVAWLWRLQGAFRNLDRFLRWNSSRRIWWLHGRGITRFPWGRSFLFLQLWWGIFGLFGRNQWRQTPTFISAIWWSYSQVWKSADRCALVWRHSLVRRGKGHGSVLHLYTVKSHQNKLKNQTMDASISTSETQPH